MDGTGSPYFAPCNQDDAPNAGFPFSVRREARGGSLNKRIFRAFDPFWEAARCYNINRIPCF